jgi:enamine deaminase RidA (YjgF/YER057c/UK114 family)
MKLTTHVPASVGKPASRFAHGVSVDGAARWLHISGQVGRELDGSVSGDTRAQMRRCLSNIIAVLEDAGMGIPNLVKLTVFITNAQDVALFRETRDQMLDGHLCASTLLVVSALASPDWTVEIEAVAAG